MRPFQKGSHAPMSDQPSHSHHPSSLHGATRLRVAAQADLPAISELERLSFVHAGERFGDRRVAYLIATPRARVMIAEAGEKVIGWICGFTWTRGREPWGRIYAVAVHPESRGRKIGPLLVHDMIRQLRQRGAGRIFLEVRPDNAPAIRLYVKFAFASCRLIANYYGPHIPAQRMARPDQPL